MSEDGNRVFYLIPLRQNDTGHMLLSFPSDLNEVCQNASPLGYGIFVFLRHQRNRFKARQLLFPAILGFGEGAQNIELTLRSDYSWPPLPPGSLWTKNANRFVCEIPRPSFPWKWTSFLARKLPTDFHLAGRAQRLEGNTLWALIPENRAQLEELWLDLGFYFVGYGK